MPFAANILADFGAKPYADESRGRWRELSGVSCCQMVLDIIDQLLQIILRLDRFGMQWCFEEDR